MAVVPHDPVIESFVSKRSGHKKLKTRACAFKRMASLHLINHLVKIIVCEARCPILDVEHDGIGIWLCARRLHHGRLLWASTGLGTTSMAMTREQLDALVLGLPWQRLGEAGVIRVV